MPKSQKVAVVTGGAGFLGSHLCDRLLADGCFVIAVDNFITGKERNIKHLSKEKNFHFLKKNVSDGMLSISGRIDYILHFASPASPVDYLNNPLETLKVGSFATYHLLELAKKKKARFFMASTSEVYGDPSVHPQKESYWGNVNPVGPRSVYDEAKRFSEAITMSYRREYKVDTKIIRIFNTYGPRMSIKDGRVVPNFIYQALNGKPLTIYGDGKQTRSFCFYSDLIDGIVRLLYSDLSGPVNIGNPGEFTILKFAELVQQMTGTKTKIIFEPLPADDPKQRKPDITQAQEKLGWVPKVKLEDGLRETIEWFKKNGYN